VQAVSCNGLEQAINVQRIQGSVEECSIDKATVYEIDPLRDARWDRFIEAHPRSSIFHSRMWLRVLHEAYGYEPFVLSTSSPTQDLENGLVFCRVKSWLTGRRLVSLPFSDHCEPLVDDGNRLDLLLAHAKNDVDQGKSKYVEIRPILEKPAATTQLELGMAYYLHKIDLEKDLQVLFRGFHKDCVQRKIRRAEKESLDYEEGCSDALLEKFYRLLLTTRRRQHLPPQPRRWFRHLVAGLGDSLKIRVVSKGGVPIASIVTILHKKTMTYKYGCSDSRYHKLGGTSQLFWKAIQEAKDKGCISFDLGRSNIDNDGLIAFKEHWGASRSPLNYWRYPHKIARRPSSLETKIVNKAVAMAPNAVLVALGQLLYPHIG
jgi:GNAT acetyltransferase-like protein